MAKTHIFPFISGDDSRPPNKRLLNYEEVARLSSPFYDSLARLLQQIIQDLEQSVLTQSLHSFSELEDILGKLFICSYYKEDIFGLFNVKVCILFCNNS